MSSPISSPDKKNLTSFQNELKNLTKEGFLSGYLVVDKNDTLHQASGFRVLWENIRGYLGYTNRADVNKVKEAASKLITGNCSEINNKEQLAKSVIDLAKKAGLITKQEQQLNDKKQLIQDIIQRAIQTSKISENTNLTEKNIKKVEDSKNAAIAKEVFSENPIPPKSVKPLKNENFHRENKLNDEGNGSSEKEGERQPELSTQVNEMDKDVVSEFIASPEKKSDVSNASKIQIPDAQPTSIERSIEDAKLSRKDSTPSSEEAKTFFQAAKIDLSNESEGSRLGALAKGALVILGALGGIYAFSNAMGPPTGTTGVNVSWVHPATEEFPPPEGFPPIINQFESIGQNETAYQTSTLETFSQEDLFHLTPEGFSPIENQQKKAVYPNSTLETSSKNIHLTPERDSPISAYLSKLGKTPSPNPTLEGVPPFENQQEKTVYPNSTLETSPKNIHLTPEQVSPLPDYLGQLEKTSGRNPTPAPSPNPPSEEVSPIPDYLSQLEKASGPNPSPTFRHEDDSFTQKWNTFKEAITTNSYVLGLGLAGGLFTLLALKLSSNSYNDFIEKQTQNEKKTKIINAIGRIKKNEDIDLKQLAEDAFTFITDYSHGRQENSDVNLDVCAEILENLLNDDVITKFLDPYKNNSEQKWLIAAFYTFFENYQYHQTKTPTGKYDNLYGRIFNIYKNKCDAQTIIMMANRLILNNPNIAKEIAVQVGTFYLSLIEKKGWYGHGPNKSQVNAVDEMLKALESSSMSVVDIPARKVFLQTLIDGIADNLDHKNYIKSCILPGMKRTGAYKLLVTHIPDLANEEDITLQETATPPLADAHQAKDAPKTTPITSDGDKDILDGTKKTKALPLDISLNGITFKYIGEYENGRIHGQGILISSSCEITGKFENGFLSQGHATMELSNGDIVVAELKDFKVHGQVIRITPNWEIHVEEAEENEIVQWMAATQKDINAPSSMQQQKNNPLDIPQEM
jgi:hypothetical protein